MARPPWRLPVRPSGRSGLLWTMPRLEANAGNIVSIIATSIIRPACALSLVEGGDDGAIEMRAREEVGDRRTSLHRRTVGKAGDADRAGRGLDGDVHG